MDRREIIKIEYDRRKIISSVTNKFLSVLSKKNHELCDKWEREREREREVIANIFLLKIDNFKHYRYFTNYCNP